MRIHSYLLQFYPKKCQRIDITASKANNSSNRWTLGVHPGDQTAIGTVIKGTPYILIHLLRRNYVLLLITTLNNNKYGIIYENWC